MIDTSKQIKDSLRYFFSGISGETFESCEIVPAYEVPHAKHVVGARIYIKSNKRKILIEEDFNPEDFVRIK